MTMKNIGSKILTEDEIVEIYKDKRDKILLQYPESIRFQLIDCHKELSKLDSWLGEKYKKTKEKKKLKEKKKKTTKEKKA